MLLFCKIPSKSGYLGLKHSLWLAKQAILKRKHVFYLIFICTNGREVDCVGLQILFRKDAQVRILLCALQWLVTLNQVGLGMVFKTISKGVQFLTFQLWFSLFFQNPKKYCKSQNRVDCKRLKNFHLEISRAATATHA